MSKLPLHRWESRTGVVDDDFAKKARVRKGSVFTVTDTGVGALVVEVEGTKHPVEVPLDDARRMGCTPSKPTPGARGTPSSMRRASAAAKIAAATPEPPPSEKPRRGTVPAMASLSEEKTERMDRALDSSAQGGARSSYSLRVESEFDAAFDGQANGGLSHSAADPDADAAEARAVEAAKAAKAEAAAAAKVRAAELAKAEAEAKAEEEAFLAKAREEARAAMAARDAKKSQSVAETARARAARAAMGTNDGNLGDLAGAAAPTPAAAIMRAAAAPAPAAAARGKSALLPSLAVARRDQSPVTPSPTARDAALARRAAAQARLEAQAAKCPIVVKSLLCLLTPCMGLDGSFKALAGLVPPEVQLATAQDMKTIMNEQLFLKTAGPK